MRTGIVDIYYNETTFAAIKESTQYIKVPCGHCAQCLARRQSDLVQRSREMAKTCHILFCTATYDNASVPRLDVADTNTGDVFQYRYADISDIQKMFKRIRKDEDLPPFKYFVVTEYGGKKHRPHFHYLLCFPKSTCTISPDLLESRFEDIFKRQWKRNYSKSTRYPQYKPLSKFIRYYKPGVGMVGTYDVHLVRPTAKDPDGSDVSFYVTKYALKFDSWISGVKSALYFNDPDFKAHWKLLKPKMLISKGYGMTDETESYIKYCVSWCRSHSPSDGIRYINPDGKTFPLAKYFYSRTVKNPDGSRTVIPFVTIQDIAAFNFASRNIIDCDVDSTRYQEISRSDISKWDNRQIKFAGIQRHLQEDLFDYIIDDLE